MIKILIGTIPIIPVGYIFYQTGLIDMFRSLETVGWTSLIFGIIYAIFISPPDYIQGDSVRIMYVHVPSSFISLFCFGFIGICKAG